MTFWRLYYHLTWATKDREPLIQPEIEDRLYGYTIRKAAELGVYVYAINGWFDHTHVVVAIPPKLAVADVVKTLKGSSSHDINHEANLAYQVQWQRGYGALSIGEKQRAAAIEYVVKQKEHHQQKTTNAWLERADELDEGPADVGILLERVPAIVREAPAVYDVLGEPPF
jgi:putative transposase